MSKIAYKPKIIIGIVIPKLNNNAIETQSNDRVIIIKAINDIK
jgi:hypothetical protein